MTERSEGEKIYGFRRTMVVSRVSPAIISERFDGNTGEVDGKNAIVYPNRSAIIFDDKGVPTEARFFDGVSDKSIPLEGTIFVEATDVFAFVRLTVSQTPENIGMIGIRFARGEGYDSLFGGPFKWVGRALDLGRDRV